MLLELLVIVLTLVAYIIKKLHDRNQYFKKLNIKHLKPKLFFGNASETMLGRKHNSEVIQAEYSAFPDEDIIGHMELTGPIYIIRNPEYVYNVLVKDFSHFHDRVKATGVIKTPRDANLFVLPGNLWRAVRYKFTPLFTSGKLRYMYTSIKDCWKNLMVKMDDADGKEIEACDLMSLFSMDVIGSCAFGLEANVLQHPDSEFRKMGQELFKGSILNNIQIFIAVTLPKLASMIRLTGFANAHLTKYFCDIISEAIEYRKKRGVERNDFVQMLLQLKEKGKIEVQIHDNNDDYLFVDKTMSTFEVNLTDDILIGGAFSFLFAGFHATAMTLSFALMEVSKRPDIVEKIRNEIKECVNESVVTYEELKKMTYLEKVVKETLRLYPTASALSRICNKDYTFPNGVKVNAGDTLFIPVRAIQTDPAYFNDPLVFNPDRFDVEPKPGTYLPFGDGPRICIAMRFALLELKFALANILQNYDIELSKKTVLPIKPIPRVFLLTPKDGIYLNVTKRKL